MMDAFNRKLEIGMQVAYVYSGSSSVRKATRYVVGFTPKMVKISSTPSGDGGAVASKNLIILSSVGL